MNLKLEANFEMSEIVAYIDAETEAWFQELLQDYKSAARKFVDRIRAKTKALGSDDKSTWNNITWNLRSSIGYLLIYKGTVVDSYFPTVGGGSEGSKTGLEFANEISLLNDIGEAIQLVVVAGMEYATFVEGKDIDVITNASKGFPKDLIKEFNR